VAPAFAAYQLATVLHGAAYDRHVAAGGRRGSFGRAAALGLLSAAICYAAMIGALIFWSFVTMPHKG